MNFPKSWYVWNIKWERQDIKNLSEETIYFHFISTSIFLVKMNQIWNPEKQRTLTIQHNNECVFSWYSSLIKYRPLNMHKHFPIWDISLISCVFWYRSVSALYAWLFIEVSNSNGYWTKGEIYFPFFLPVHWNTCFQILQVLTHFDSSVISVP